MMSVQRMIIAVGVVLIGLMGTTPLQAQTQRAPAYVVIEFTIKDPEGFRDYSQRAPATVAQYGGKFAVRGARVASLKGDVPRGPFAVLEFESAEHAQKWASSPEYKALVPLRDKSAETRAFIVEGITP